MRYTEARLTAIAAEMLADIDKDTVDFEDNYDGTQKQPSVLPAKLPNLLINGSVRASPSGWRRTSRRTTSARSVDATIALIDDPDITTDDLCKYVQRPRLPDRRHDLSATSSQRNVAGGSGRRSTRSARCTPTAAAGS